MDQLTLGGDTARGRRRGPVRRQLDVSLLAWRRDGTLGGDDHAAYRSALRAAADAVDAAAAALREGEGTAYTLSVCARTFADLVTAVHPVAPVEGGSGGTFADLVRELGAPSLSD